MSTTKFLVALSVLAGVILGSVTITWVLPTVFEDHDGWGIIPSLQADMKDTARFISEPDDLLASRAEETLRRIVEDTRKYGIPWSIAVVSDTALDPNIPVEDQARALYDETNIESRPDADDGLLMYVVIPDGAHTETSVHFVTGANFYPTGGITPERLQWIADVQIAPIIAENRIGRAVVEGATWVEWMQLFEPTPDPAPTNLQTGIDRLLHPLGTLALAGLLVVGAGGAIAVAVLTRRGTAPETTLELDPVNAAALANGRVDRQVIAGVILDAVDRSALHETTKGLEYQTLESDISHRQIDAHLTSAIDALSGQNVAVTPANLNRFLQVSPLPTALEDDLAQAGYFHPGSYRLTFWLRIGALVGSLVGLLALVLAVLGEVESTIAAALPLTALSIAILVWNEFRSWTTNAGRASLVLWLTHHRDDRDRALFEAIRHLDRDEPSPFESTFAIQNQPGLVDSLRLQK